MDSFTVIDFHSHILPALDHGCEKTRECKEQLKLMKSSGTQIAVATSHFYPHLHDVDVFSEKVRLAMKKIQESDISEAPQLRLGAEVLLCNGMDSMQNLDKLCIKGTKLLLLELPLSHIERSHLETVENLIQDGYRVLLAHIDRYIENYPDEIDYLIGAGALAQINAHSLASRSIRKQLTSYLDAEKIHAIGSDLHGVDASNYKKFVKAKKILGDYYADIMKKATSLLEGSEIFTVNG